MALISDYQSRPEDVGEILVKVCFAFVRFEHKSACVGILVSILHAVFFCFANLSGTRQRKTKQFISLFTIIKILTKIWVNIRYLHKLIFVISQFVCSRNG